MVTIPRTSKPEGNSGLFYVFYMLADDDDQTSQNKVTPVNDHSERKAFFLY